MLDCQKKLNILKSTYIIANLFTIYMVSQCEKGDKRITQLLNEIKCLMWVIPLTNENLLNLLTLNFSTEKFNGAFPKNTYRALYATTYFEEEYEIINLAKSKNKQNDPPP